MNETKERPLTTLVMNTKLFGTDGIRARAGEFPLNGKTVAAIGQAIGEKLGGTILVGQDTRVSSPWIMDHLLEGLSRTKAVPEDAGVIPTPAIALLVKENHFAGGIMISASHNPYHDNGIKVFSSNGTKLDDVSEASIEGRVFEIISNLPRGIEHVPDRTVSAENSTGWPERYADLLLSHFPNEEWLKGMRVVMDCANGAMSQVAPAVFKRLGAHVHVIHAGPTGKNINAGCGAVHLGALLNEMKSEMQRTAADFGVAFDGDGDRSLFASGGGRELDGDAVLLLMARRLKRSGRLNPAIVVGTLMTNFALEQTLGLEGIVLTRVGVGDRYVFDEMNRSGSALGGEPSGHIIFSDFRLSGDGLLTTLKVAQAIVEDRAAFDDLSRTWAPAPNLLKGVRVRQKVPIEKMPTLQAKMAEASRVLAGCGRMVVRYSGTEPLLRVMIESDDASRNSNLMDELLAAVRKDLGTSVES
jgi:phosphoglucosamine mutase